MKSSRFTIFGWAAAAALGSILLAGAFNQEQPKFGVVDMNKAITSSNIGTANTTRLRNAVQKREAFLTFVSTNPVITSDQIRQLKVIELKDAPTQQERTTADGIKQAVQSDQKEFDRLNQKAEPTEADRQRLGEFNRRRNETQRSLGELSTEFQSDIGNIQNQVRTAEREKAEAALGKVGSDGGYTVIFEKQVAPYGSNDVTEAVKNALNEAGN